MKEKPNQFVLFVLGVLCLGTVCILLWRSTPKSASARNTESVRLEQSASAPGESEKLPSGESQTNTTEAAPSPESKAPELAQAPSPQPPSQPGAPSAEPPQAAPQVASQPASSPSAPPNVAPSSGSNSAESSDEVQLSFQGANIDMVVQWLAKTTGKSVVKHPRVQCQLTIVSSKKMTQREALTVVYRALALEGFTTIESSQAILIVPEAQEPKLSPELMNSTSTDLPEGRQRVVKVFQLDHVPATEVRDRVKSVLSEKAVVEADARGNKLIVTDYTDNLRLLGELIPELDTVSSSDSVIEIYPLKHSEATELANLLTLVLNQQAPPPSSSSPSPSPSRPSPMHPGGPSPSPPGGSSSPSAASAAGLQIRVWPDKTANRVIVAAPRSKIPEVERLLNILDVEKPADVSVRVIPLKHVNAEDLVKEIGPLYQKMSSKSLKDTIEVTANIRSNSMIVLSSESNYKAIERLVSSLDTEDAQEKVTQAFPLKNADAQDVAQQLQDLYREQDTSARYVYYFSAPSGRSSKKLSVVADRRRNTVIVQSAPAVMPAIEAMIQALDEPVTDDSLAPKIFPLKYVSAMDIEDVLNELFLKQQDRRSYWDYYYYDSGSSNRDQDAGRLYGKVRITSEPYSNSIIVTSNSPENLAAVEEVLKELDVPSQAGETTLRVPLKFAQAVEVASSMNILFAKAGSPTLRPAPQQPQQPDYRGQQQETGTFRTSFELEEEVEEQAYYPWLGGPQEDLRSGESRSAVRPVSDLIGRVRVVPDRRTNSLLITSNVHFFPQVLKLINDLDAPTPQVLIEAKIIEVASDFRDRLGVRWSPDGRSFEPEDFDNSILPSVAASQREVFLGSTLANSLRTGVIDASVSLDILIQFLRKNTHARVLAEPQINVRDNELGKLFVGARVPFISSTFLTDVGAKSESFRYIDVGVILEVTPHINNEEEVALKIRAESSNIRNGQILLGGAILDTRNFRTDLLVRSGETVVLGGIIQREESDVLRKTPILGSIPGLGWAFKKRDTVSREVELMVFLRPRITRSPEESRQLVQEIEEKAPRLKDWKDGLNQNERERERLRSLE